MSSGTLPAHNGQRWASPRPLEVSYAFGLGVVSLPWTSTPQSLVKWFSILAIQHLARHY